MQIVIDIDDEQVLFDIKNQSLEAKSETDKVIINALYNGTTLPKGHGRLIDSAELLNMTKSYKSELKRLNASPSFVFGVKTVENFVNDLPKIIDADKQEMLASNLTNGDAIKKLFPNCKDWKAKIEDDDEEVYEVHFVQLPNSMTVNKYEEKWWNAPYKESEE